MKYQLQKLREQNLASNTFTPQEFKQILRSAPLKTATKTNANQYGIVNHYSEDSTTLKRLDPSKVQS